MLKRRVAITVGIGLGFWCQGAMAADTIETFDLGASDFELYSGFEGVGLPKYQRAFTMEALAGFGLREHWSGYLSLGTAANDRLSGASGEFGLGTFATLLDSNHLDLDLFLGSNYTDGSMAVTPAFELNLDAKPELEAYGLYLRVGEQLTGRDSTSDEAEGAEEAEERHEFTPSTELTLGAYLTIAEGQQLLLEYDMTFHHGDWGAEPPPRAEIGNVVVGHNRQILDNIELITQAGVDIPNEGERASANAMIGIVVTMPASASAK